MTRVLFTFALFGARISLEWKFADLWIGAFYARSKTNARRWDVWVCLLPCLPIHVEYPRPVSGREFLAAVDRRRAENPDVPPFDDGDIEALEREAYVCGCAFCVAVGDDPEDDVPCRICGRVSCICVVFSDEADDAADDEANHV